MTDSVAKWVGGPRVRYSEWSDDYVRIGGWYYETQLTSGAQFRRHQLKASLSIDETPSGKPSTFWLRVYMPFSSARITLAEGKSRSLRDTKFRCARTLVDFSPAGLYRHLRGEHSPDRADVYNMQGEWIATVLAIFEPPGGILPPGEYVTAQKGRFRRVRYYDTGESCHEAPVQSLLDVSQLIQKPAQPPSDLVYPTDGSRCGIGRPRQPGKTGTFCEE